MKESYEQEDIGGKKIGIAREESFGVEAGEQSDIISGKIDIPIKGEKGEKVLICDAAFPCPSCGNRIKIQIKETVNEEGIGGKKKGIIFWPETKMMTREEAVRWFKEIRAGSGVYRADFPDAMKGTLAKQHWDDPVFLLGVEYGVLIALKKIFGIVVDGGKKT